MPLVYTNPDGSRIYDVEKAVGVNSPNQRMDVKLVQYMLHEIYAARFAPPPTPTPLAVDAWIGPQTITWIKRFQSDINRPETPGQQCVADGRVDAITNPSGRGLITKQFLTISWMNTALKQLNRIAFDNIPNVVPCMPATMATRPNPYNPDPAPMCGGG